MLLWELLRPVLLIGEGIIPCLEAGRLIAAVAANFDQGGRIVVGSMVGAEILVNIRSRIYAAVRV